MMTTMGTHWEPLFFVFERACIRLCLKGNGECEGRSRRRGWTRGARAAGDLLGRLLTGQCPLATVFGLVFGCGLVFHRLLKADRSDRKSDTMRRPRFVPPRALHSGTANVPGKENSLISSNAKQGEGHPRMVFSVLFTKRR